MIRWKKCGEPLLIRLEKCIGREYFKGDLRLMGEKNGGGA
jgi:hypothetical protein